MSGWFPVARGITAHPLMKAQPERLALWLWLLDHAAWKQTTFDVKGKLVVVPSGSVFVAVRRLAEETGVGYQVARTFLRHLQRAGLIRIEPKHGLSLISILGQAKDPQSPDQANAAPNAALTQSQRTKEEGKTSVSEDTGAGAPLSLEEQVLASGIALLMGAGQSSRAAHALIGKWKHSYGSAAVIAAVGAAQRAGASDPAAYCTRVLEKAATKADATHFGSFGRIPEVG